MLKKSRSGGLKRLENGCRPFTVVVVVAISVTSQILQSLSENSSVGGAVRMRFVISNVEECKKVQDYYFSHYS